MQITAKKAINMTVVCGTVTLSFIGVGVTPSKQDCSEIRLFQTHLNLLPHMFCFHSDPESNL